MMLMESILMRKNKDAGPRVTIETNIDPYGGKNKKKTKEKAYDKKDLDLLEKSPADFEETFKADSDNM